MFKTRKNGSFGTSHGFLDTRTPADELTASKAQPTAKMKCVRGSNGLMNCETARTAFVFGSSPMLTYQTVSPSILVKNTPDQFYSTRLGGCFRTRVLTSTSVHN